MNCDEVELSLPEGADDPQLRAHLAGCAGCRETAAVLGLASQAPLSAAEKARLVSLPLSVQAQWSRVQRRRDGARKFIGLAVAASLGAVVASGVMWKLNRPALVLDEPVISAALEDVGSPVAEEELSFEVSWPSLNEEGEVL